MPGLRKHGCSTNTWTISVCCSLYSMVCYSLYITGCCGVYIAVRCGAVLCVAVRVHCPIRNTWLFLGSKSALQIPSMYVYIYMCIYIYMYLYLDMNKCICIGNIHPSKNVSIKLWLTEVRLGGTDIIIVDCSTVQHTATQCNTLQHTATQCYTVQHSAAQCNTVQHIATHCNTLQHTRYT